MPRHVPAQRLHTSAASCGGDSRDHDSGDDFKNRRPMPGFWHSGVRVFNNRMNGKTFHNELEKSLRKDFFQPSDEVLRKPKEHHENFLHQHKITVYGHDVPPPIQKFTDQQFPEGISRNLTQFDAPTLVQAQGWSIALKGLDMIGIGQTGPGKTLGYLVPGLLHVAHNQRLYNDQQLRRPAPIGLVLAPTRELVEQIMAVAGKFGPPVGVTPVAISAGGRSFDQLRLLRSKAAQLVVATPGRLLYFLENKRLTLDRCSFLVLDEAERMLNMGYRVNIRDIVQRTRSDRQTLMWTATWFREVQALAGSLLTDAVQLRVGSAELRASPDISQHVHVCSSDDKLPKLEALLREMLAGRPDAQALVFCNMKSMVDNVCYKLRREGFRARAIHGNKARVVLDDILNGFRQKQLSVLVATSTTAQVIGFPDLRYVVNYDFPSFGVEDYVRCIERTVGQGNKGVAHTFFTRDDKAHALKLTKVLQASGQPVSEALQALA